MVLFLAVVFSTVAGYAQRIEVGAVLPARQTPVHDPVVIKQDSTYYLFCTGMGISVWSSRDMKEWKKEKPVFATPPDWAVKTIKGYRGHTWAPDINLHNGLYYLYYSVSAFGKNTSCIGVATNRTLNANSPDFLWVDHGKVVQSVPGRDMWNAIDPNLIIDNENVPWLVFGSFWNGMKLTRLSADMKKLANPEEWYTVAARKRNVVLPDSVAGDAAIEAPFIFKKDKFFYLFVSFDYCCRGEKSTYKVMVGRSPEIRGPYVDSDGVPMNIGGGSLVIEGNKEWHGVGHSATVSFDGVDYLFSHGYDAADTGRSKLRIDKI
ncbi:MAG: arabinan endo-1,5-alpha-L-arabinosidase, partial [Gemmatimonadaceae bacterium]|nr:arabinan endo-1,5-alpha-L-arabinosidase [Chitinophagaceae bacterium]